MDNTLINLLKYVA